MGNTKEKALELQRNYQREWRRKNKDKVKKYNKTYWERKALACNELKEENAQ